MIGRHAFTLPEPIANGALRPLNATLAASRMPAPAPAVRSWGNARQAALQLDDGRGFFRAGHVGLVPLPAQVCNCPRLFGVPSIALRNVLPRQTPARTLRDDDEEIHTMSAVAFFTRRRHRAGVLRVLGVAHLATLAAHRLSHDLKALPPVGPDDARKHKQRRQMPDAGSDEGP